MSSSTGSTTSSPRPRAASDRRRGGWPGFLALTSLGALLVACRTAPSAPADPLLSLLGSAAAGERPDPHAWVDPGDSAHAAAFVQLEQWVNVNAEAVTDVRAADLPAEPSRFFTRSADGRVTYAIAVGWPGAQLRTKALRPAPGTRVRLLGWPEDLPWEQLGAVCVVTTPRELADEENHPCERAFVFRFEAPR